MFFFLTDVFENLMVETEAKIDLKWTRFFCNL
jgi:hypothetical protein